MERTLPATTLESRALEAVAPLVALYDDPDTTPDDLMQSFGDRAYVLRALVNALREIGA